MGKAKDIIKGLFFWRKNPEKESAKAEEMLKLYLKYIPQLRAIMNGANPDLEVSDGELIGRMYDFYQDAGFAANTMANPIDLAQFQQGNVGPNGLTVPEPYLKPTDERKDKKPVEVVSELETVPTPFTLEGLDEKIELFKDKKKISTQRYAREQIKGFLKRLENRKHYEANISFYSQFKNTTDDKIDKLLANYKLEMNESELFIPTFPKEATEVMKKYTEVTKKFAGEAPVFYVIAEEKDFRKKREKLDPILLVQSPFGFYWQILGAWDKEMLLLTEL